MGNDFIVLLYYKNVENADVGFLSIWTLKGQESGSVLFTATTLC
jgi:hypothetical protein